MTYLEVADFAVERVHGTPAFRRRSRLGGSLDVVPRYLVAEVV